MFDPITIILSIYVLITVGVAYTVRNTDLISKEGFMLGNRQASEIKIAFSAASCWAYVFALVINSRFTYDLGLAGFFWYSLPYVLTIIYFGFIAKSIVSKLPEGFTLSEYISKRYQNKNLTYLYQILQLAAAVYAITANLTGFGILAEYVSTDFNYNTIILVLGITVLAYSLWGGIRSCHVTDFIQMPFILIVSVTFGVISVFKSGGFSTVITNWLTAKPESILSVDKVLDPGILLFLLFAGSIMADNSHYQNALSLKKGSRIVRTYFMAGIILLLTLIGLALLAAGAYSVPVDVTKGDLASIIVTKYHFGEIGAIIFMLMVLFKASSVLDSSLNGAGTILANDVVKKGNPVKISRLTMIVVMTLGIILTTMKIDLWILITTFGMLRVLAVAPTVYALFIDKKININGLMPIMVVTGAIGVGLTLIDNPVGKLPLNILILSVPLCYITYLHFRKQNSTLQIK